MSYNARNDEIRDNITRGARSEAMENPLTLITSLASGKNRNESKGVVKRDWGVTATICDASRFVSES